DAKAGSRVEPELLRYARQGLREVVYAGDLLGRRAEAAQGVPALFDDRGHQLQHAAQARFFRRVRGDLVDGDVKLHGGAEKTLQQRVVQIPGDPRPLGEPLLELQVQACRDLADVPAINRPCQERQGCEAQEEEAAGLIERGKDGEVEPCGPRIPDAVVVAGDDAETIAPRLQIGEEGFTARSGVVPITVRSREPIAKTDLLRYGEAESRIVDLDVSRERRQTQA